MKKIVLPLAAGLVLLSCAINKKTTKTFQAIASTVKTDTTKKDSVKKIKPYNEIITAKAIPQNGLFKVHQVDQRWYFEIADSLLDKDILIVNRVRKAPSGLKPNYGRSGYAGESIGENVIHFEKGPEQKIFIRRLTFLDITGDTSVNGLSRSLYNSGMQPIVASFDIKAVSPDSVSVVIDVTDYLKTDNDVFFFNSLYKTNYQLGALQPDKSYIAGIHAYPLNTEIRTIKTYLSTNELANRISGPLVTYELNSSIVLLPANPMKTRDYDPRVGYFAQGYRNFETLDGVDVNYKVTRWRMEPKDADVGKYKRGELVEPKKPIVFYIDPATPKKWVRYLIAGVNAWEKAFEKAGFKNAIYAMEVPETDTTWSLEDARHNAIVYMASDFQNAQGGFIRDPRTGEILESHVYWYHNVLQLLHDWYMIQAGPNDPGARKMQFDDTLMGKLVKYVCMHEIGHTLGLQHNFRASATIPTDSLRSRQYVARNGHTPSIMDYARFNYVAQPEDSIAVDDLIPRIGVYDEWAIEWGYKWLNGFKSLDEEKTWLNNWVIGRLKQDSRLAFSDLTFPSAFCKAEDLGDDAAKAGIYGIKNLKRVLANLPEWTKTPNGNYDALKRITSEVIMQYSNYISHAMDDIGNLCWNPQTVEQGGPQFTFLPREKQRDAVRFLQQELFDTPGWIADKKIFSLTAGAGVVWIYRLQEWWMTSLASPGRWNAMLFDKTNLPASKSYDFNELLNDLEGNIWKELKDHRPIEMNRRNLQKIYVYKLLKFLELQKPFDLGMTDACTEVLEHVRKIDKMISKALPRYKDPASKAHLLDLHERLKKVLLDGIEPAKQPGTLPMPSKNALTYPSMNLESRGCFEFGDPLMKDDLQLDLK